ncbi:MAG: M20/M25/M40 family metallo-hydrolase [Lachnospiraceae bacterium]|nr:M20/M25/M40 family metallo-hydrolase [Lachnospiraceae bacterium]
MRDREPSPVSISEDSEEKEMAEKIYERLNSISYSRPSGSAEEQKTLDYLAAEIRGMGFDPEIEEFSYERRVPAEAYVAAVLEDGTEVPFPVTGMTDSMETAPEGETAEFYYLRSYDEVSLTRVRGKIVLIHGRLSFEEYRRIKNAGIAGYIVTSGTIRDTYENSDLETARFRDNLAELGTMPAFTIRMIDAVALLRLRPEKLRFKLRLQEETVRSRNLSVTVPGTDLPEEILAVGAHYDSVPYAIGSWDNGAGAVEMLSLLEHLKEQPARRTVKVILFGSEETGLRGSRAYVEAHPEVIEKTKAMLNIDVGGSILGKELIFLAASDDTEVWVRQLLKENGYEAVTVKMVMSSDSASFNDAGIPSISIGQDAPQGGGYMHTRYDNMELIDENVLKREADFIIYLVHRLADPEVFPVPRFLPDSIRKGVIGYFGEKNSRLAKMPAVPEEKPLPFHF